MSSTTIITSMAIALLTGSVIASQEVPEDFKDNRIQDRDKKVVVTCGLGLCAAIGGKLLKDMGFKDVVLLEGGVEKWREDGYELEK